MQITICGGGNAPHTAAGLLAAREEHRVNVYLSRADEAKLWQAGITSLGGMTVLRQEGTIKSLPQKISSDPAQVIPGSQMVLLALPAFAHESVLGEIAPYLEPGTLVGALAAKGAMTSAPEIS